MKNLFTMRSASVSAQMKQYNVINTNIPELQKQVLCPLFVYLQ